MRIRYFRLPLLQIAIVGLFAAAGGAAAVAASSGDSPASGMTHLHRTLQPSEQTHDSGGPYITQVKAEATATSIDGGALGRTVISSQLQTVASASTTLGERVASAYVSDDRSVWVIKVHGPYQYSFGPPGTAKQVADHYFVIVDGTTGTVLATGSNPNVAW